MPQNQTSRALERSTRMRHAWLAALLVTSSLTAQESSLNVRTASDSEGERATQQQLYRLLQEHDVSEWLYTRDVIIDQTKIPHSHPVLTLHTRHLNDDLGLLSTFIHEQFHWLVDEQEDKEAAAIAAFRDVFPGAPGREGGGARDSYSSYLHLIVCDLEFQGMTLLLGEEVAREVLGSITHYEWVYERVLNDPRVRETTERFGFVLR